MFNNLYQVEQAGREHQQALLEIQRMADQSQTACPARAPHHAFHRLAQRIPSIIGALLHARSTASWLTRLFVLVAAVACFAAARPAAAATSTGSTSAGAHGVIDPETVRGQRAVTDPFTSGSFTPVQDPAAIGGHSSVSAPLAVGNVSPVLDGATTTGTGAVIDPGASGGNIPVTDPAAVGNAHASVTAGPSASVAEYLVWLAIVLVLMGTVAANGHRRYARG